VGFNLKQKLRRSSDALAGKLDRLFGGESIEDADMEEAEEILLGSDLGWELTEEVINELPGKVKKSGLSWKEALAEILIENVPVPAFETVEAKPCVTVVVGVNGAGKTTTIARLAARLQKGNEKVLLEVLITDSSGNTVMHYLDDSPQPVYEYISNYRIRDVYVFNDSLVAIIMNTTGPGFEGPDGMFRMVTGVIGH